MREIKEGGKVCVCVRDCVCGREGRVRDLYREIR